MIGFEQDVLVIVECVFVQFYLVCVVVQCMGSFEQVYVLVVGGQCYGSSVFGLVGIDDGVVMWGVYRENICLVEDIGFLGQLEFVDGGE